MNRDRSLRALGWTESRSQEFQSIAEEGLEPARVVAVHRGSCVVAAAGGELSAAPSGRFLRSAGPEDLPAVGDWVAFRRSGERGVIHRVLERTTKFSRKVAGLQTAEQVLVANVDIVFLVVALNEDFNLRRLERYLATAYASRALPVVVLTKADLSGDPVSRALEAETVAPGVPVLVTSTVTGEGLSEVAAHAAPGLTVALLGSSGAGKSSLVNALAGRELQRVEEIRSDGKGRHTTTHRQLFALPSGALVVDTPGMRELQLWDVEEGLDPTFGDVAELAEGCKFGNCAHESEPGCAVRAALADGTLDEDRFAAYRKLQRELAFLERKRDRRAQAEETRKWKVVHRAMRSRTR